MNIIDDFQQALNYSNVVLICELGVTTNDQLLQIKEKINLIKKPVIGSIIFNSKKI